MPVELAVRERLGAGGVPRGERPSRGVFLVGLDPCGQIAVDLLRVAIQSPPRRGQRCREAERCQRVKEITQHLAGCNGLHPAGGRARRPDGTVVLHNVHDLSLVRIGEPLGVGGVLPRRHLRRYNAAATRRLESRFMSREVNPIPDGIGMPTRRRQGGDPVRAEQGQFAPGRRLEAQFLQAEQLAQVGGLLRHPLWRPAAGPVHRVRRKGDGALPRSFAASGTFFRPIRAACQPSMVMAAFPAATAVRTSS